VQLSGPPRLRACRRSAETDRHGSAHCCGAPAQVRPGSVTGGISHARVCREALSEMGNRADAQRRDIEVGARAESRGHTRTIASDSFMIRYDCFEWLAPIMTDQLVVTSLSGQRVEWGHLSKREADLNLGSMGNALAVGIGLALALPHRKVFVFEYDGSVLFSLFNLATRKVFVCDSDGSVLLSLFNLPTLANLDPPNLAVFVFDNQAYSGTRISYPSATARKTDLAAVARGSGIEHSVTVSALEDFKKEATAALNDSGLRFVVCKIEESLGHRQITRSNVDLMETKYRFVRYLERTEGKAIFQGRG